MNTPLRTLPAPLATPINVLNEFTKLLTMNPPNSLATPNTAVNVPDSTPTATERVFITFSFDKNPANKSARAIAIGSITANKPFIIFSNASVILFNLACPSSVLLSDSLNAAIAPTINVIAPKATLNPNENLFNPSLKLLIPLPTAPIGPGNAANWSSN